MKKMTLNTLTKIMSTSPTTNNTISFEIDGEIIHIEVKPFISLQEMSDIIDSSVNAAFTDSGIAYEYKEAVFKYKIIDTLTNIPTLKSKDTVNLVKYTEIYDRLGFEDKLSYMNDYMRNLMNDLRTAIYNKLEYQKQIIIHSTRTDELVDAVINFLEKTTETINGLGTLVDGLKVDSINEIVTKVAKDGGIDLNSLKGLLDVGVKDASKVGSESAPNLEVVK